MDTTYYTLDTRRVKVSGGGDLLWAVPAVAPRPAGEVLDFDRCRRRLETRAAWRALAQAAEAEIPQETAEREERPRPAPERARRRERLSCCLELGASAAAILAGLCASWAFLAVL